MKMAKFQFREATIYYEMSGSGIPIVFIHPPALGRVVFKKQAELKRFFTVITPDLSGNGDSTGGDRNVTIQGYAEEIRALLDHLQIEKAVICGYSAGGTVAQEFALRYPLRTLAVILLSGYPQVLSASFRYEHLLGMYLAKKFPDLLAALIAFSHTNEPELRKELRQHMKKANQYTWLHWYEQSLQYSCLERLHELTVPLLLIYGAKDFSNQHLRAYKKQLQADAVIIPDVSHQLPIKKAKIVNQTIVGFIYEQLKPERNNIKSI